MLAYLATHSTIGLNSRAIALVDGICCRSHDSGRLFGHRRPSIWCCCCCSCSNWCRCCHRTEQQHYYKENNMPHEGVAASLVAPALHTRMTKIAHDFAAGRPPKPASRVSKGTKSEFLTIYQALLHHPTGPESKVCIDSKRFPSIVLLFKLVSFHWQRDAVLYTLNKLFRWSSSESCNI